MELTTVTTWQAYPVERREHAGSDNAIKAMAEKGRAMGQVVLSSFCEERDRMGMRVTLSDFADMID
ncbi:MAG: hypothetical protein IMY83_04840 [Chloroflexi bacterium]|nr:hypothetical protein [Chloroflexota bacterium]